MYLRLQRPSAFCLLLMLNFGMPMPHFWTSNHRHGLKAGMKDLDHTPGCLEHPTGPYGPHRGYPYPDGTGVWPEGPFIFSVYVDGNVTTKMCAGKKHLIRLTFTDDFSYRQALLSASQGTFDYYGEPGFNSCPNRIPFDGMSNKDFDLFMASWQDGKGSFYNATLTLPCNATGSVLLQSTSATKAAEGMDGKIDYLRDSNATVDIDPACSVACPPPATTSSQKSPSSAPATRLLSVFLAAALCLAISLL